MFLAAPVLAKDTKVLVVPIHGKAGGAFDGSVTRLLEKPLKRHATVIAGPQAKQAQRKAHVRPAGLHNAKNVRKLGKASGASYVLIVEATGRKPHLAANTTLVDVQTGKTVLSDRYDLSGAKLTPEVAAQILSPIVEKLGGGGGGDDSGAEADTSATEGDGADGEAKPVAKKAGKKYDWPANKTGGDEAGEDPTEPATASADDAESTDSDATSDEDGGVSGSIHTRGDKPPKWRPALRLIVGASVLQRDARISASNMPSGVTPPCYCGTKNNSNPFFPAAHIGAELYPFAFAGKGTAIEGLGITADMTVTQVKSFVQPAAGASNPNAQVIGSTLFEMRIGPTYRWVLWDSVNAPDINFNAGFGLFMFPLSMGGFPGVSYTAPYLGATGHIPLGFPELQLIAGATIMPGLQGGSAATQLLSDTGKQTGGTAFNLDGGLRFAWDRWEISGLVRYQVYNMSYAGNTKFQQPADGSAVTQLSNVSLSDKYLELMITGGVVF